MKSAKPGRSRHRSNKPAKPYGSVQRHNKPDTPHRSSDRSSKPEKPRRSPQGSNKPGKPYGSPQRSNKPGKPHSSPGRYSKPEKPRFESHESDNKQRERVRHADLETYIRILDEQDVFDLMTKSSEPPLLLILDGITDPHNFGACLRTAETAGVHAVIIPKDRSAPVTRVVREVASGAAERVPIAQITNLARFMGQLKERNVWIIGTSHRTTKSLYEMDFRGPVALILGSEGEGMRRLTEEECDFVCRIPMRGQVECLNASVAAGVCLFEAVRQRLSK